MFLPWIGESHLLPSGLYRRCRSFNGSAICNMISDILPMGRGLYRRLGLSPDPEDSGRKCMEKFLLFQVNVFRQLADFVLQVFGNAEFVAASAYLAARVSRSRVFSMAAFLAFARVSSQMVSIYPCRVPSCCNRCIPESRFPGHRKCNPPLSPARHNPRPQIAARRGADRTPR